MKKSLMGFSASFFLMTAVFTLGFGSSVIAADNDYKIGCVFSVTGNTSWLGEPQKKTVEMIADEINAKGGIKGRKISLFIEDNQGDNTRTVNAVKKLVQKDKVCAIIGPSESGTTMAVIPVIQKMETPVPLLSCAAAEEITKPASERKWIFKMGQNDSDAVRRIYENMNKKGIKKVGILTATNGFGNAGRKKLTEMASEFGLQIVSDETYNPSDTDMTAQLLKIQKAGAEAAVNWSIVPAQSIVPKNMKQLKMSIPLYQSHGFANVKYAEAAGDAAEGLVFPAGRVMAVSTLPDGHPQKAVLNEYKTAYEAKYKDHVSTFGGHAYDGLWLVVKAIEAVGDDPAKIRDYIETAQFTGTGGQFKFSAADHNGLDKNAFEMLTVKNGQFVVLGE
ncbi:ABC transporter substrate-binding protein [Desulforegula conservatrix]|uniref:ABC transporter substrate-binding protein n=1 Tax=Desulforegula conservatrix TaxID=153026 RepID=UPI00042A73CD|nr:ABC transporter substrate-binding protein [Desulforegula conservatrix]